MDDEVRINFVNPEEVNYWAKKWEISSFSLYEAWLQIRNNTASSLKKYLRGKGFAL